MDHKLPTVLRVGYAATFPSVSSRCEKFPTLIASPKCTHPGQLVEIIDLIAKQLNMEIEAVPLLENHLNDSIYKGLDMLENKQIDTIALGFQHSADRDKLFSFTKPIYKIQSRILMKRDDNVYSGIGGFLNTYQLETWFIIFIALILQCCLAIVTRKVEVNMRLTKKISVLESIWQTMSLQLMKPEKVHFESKAGNFSIMVFSLVQCTILLGIFSSCILSNILHANLYPPISSMDSLIRRISKRDNYLISATPNNWFYQNVRTSMTYPYLELNNALKRNPLQFSSTTNETLHKVQGGKAVVFAQDDDSIMYASLRHCNLVYLADSLPKKDTHLLMSKNSTLLEVFNKVIEDNMVHIMRICRKYIAMKDRIDTCVQSHAYKPLEIFPYIGTLVVCAALFGIAFVVLLFEMLWHMKQNNNKTETLCLYV